MSRIKDINTKKDIEGIQERRSTGGSAWEDRTATCRLRFPAVDCDL